MKYFIFVELMVVILVILVILAISQPISLGLPTSAGAGRAGFTPLETGWMGGYSYDFQSRTHAAIPHTPQCRSFGPHASLRRCDAKKCI